MQYNLIHLMPYDEDVILNSLSSRIRVLELLNFLGKQTKQAIHSFLSSAYHDFDAQVSENLCQVRAYQLSCYLESNIKGSCIKPLEAISFIQIRCEALLNEYTALTLKRPSSYSKQIDNSITLRKFLEDNGLVFCFNELIYFLSQTYILSRYKLVGEFEISLGIDYEKFCSELKISSKTYARKVIHCLQRNISELSCRFILKLLAELDAKDSKIQLLKSLYFKDEVGRHVIPCFETTTILLEHALKSGKHIKVSCIRVKEDFRDAVHFFFKPSDQKDKYLLMSQKEDAPKHAILFTGISHFEGDLLERNEIYICRFISAGFEEIILSNMAQHPQYAGLLLDTKKYNPYADLDFSDLPLEYQHTLKQEESKFLDFKRKADQIGCSSKNKNLFLLTHVRCQDLSGRQKKTKYKESANETRIQTESEVL
jgi:hypothetical protein